MALPSTFLPVRQSMPLRALCSHTMAAANRTLRRSLRRKLHQARHLGEAHLTMQFGPLRAACLGLAHILTKPTQRRMRRLHPMLTHCCPIASRNYRERRMVNGTTRRLRSSAARIHRSTRRILLLRQALQLAGGLASGGAALSAAPTVAKAALGMGGKSLIARMLASGASGAGIGAIQGFGAGEGGAGNRLSDAETSALIGGSFGTAVPVAGNLIGKGIRSVASRSANARRRCQRGRPISLSLIFRKKV